MTRFAFYFDSSACSGCKACQAACKDKNDLEPGINWRRVYDIQGGEWKEVNGVITSHPYNYFLSVSCMNCGNPPCVPACPTKALYENGQGIIAVDEDLCIGCRYCEWACPYGAPQFDSKKKVITKCDLCADYISAGMKPSCVTSCPMRAMDFGKYGEMAAKYGGNGKIYPLPDPAQTGPGFIVKLHKDSLRAEKESAEITGREDF